MDIGMLLNNLSSYKQFVVSSLALCFFSSYCIAAPSIEDYGRLPSTSLMTLSPSGDRVAFRQVEGGNDIVAVVSLKNGKSLHTIDASDVDPKRFRFITNDDLVLIASRHKKVPGFKGSFDVSTAYRLNLGSGNLEELLMAGRGIYPGQSGLGEIVGISSDGQHLYMPAWASRGGDKANTGIQSTVGGVDPNPNYSLMKVNINKPKRIKPHEKGNSRARGYFISSEGSVIAIERYSNEENLHQIVVPDGRSWSAIYELETDIPEISIVAVGSNEDSLVVLKQSGRDDRTVYATMSLSDGNIKEASFNKKDKDVEEVITDINQKALGVRYSGFMPSYYFFDNNVNSFVSEVQKLFPDHSVWLVSWSDNFEKIVVRVAGSSYADEYFLFDQSLKPQYLASQRPNITSDDINPIGTVTYSARDGLKIPTLLTIPRSKVDKMKNLPAVVLPHGGPEIYDRIGFNWLAQALASQGYLVVQPQFRGSSGFGLAHTMAGNGEWGKKMQSDVTDGVDFFVRKGIIDPERICIMGWSYGGYAALAGGALTPDRYKCVVSINGVSDLPLMLQQERSDHGRHHWVLSYWENTMAAGEVNKDLLREVSPAYRAKDFKSSVLLIHGDRDQVVNIRQSKRMRLALEREGVPVELIVMKKDGHSLLNGKNRIKAVQASIEFINEYLQ
jgi:dipeptidyl aminopeptidase/acylaminoacyl peptidase